MQGITRWWRAVPKLELRREDFRRGMTQGHVLAIGPTTFEQAGWWSDTQICHMVGMVCWIFTANALEA